jgi:hypothetical protein
MTSARPSLVRWSLTFLLLASCTQSPTVVTTSAPSLTSTSTSTSTPTPTASATSAGPVTAVYPWGPTSEDRLDVRFPAPPGFTRVPVADGSFGAFLRTLPLLPEGSPVVSFKGDPLYSGGHHPSIAAVADLDVGKKDLQHCADVIIRLNAEWHYGRGEHDVAYRSVSGATLSYKRYVAGERALVEGGKFSVRAAAAPAKDDHELFRAYLDDVFAWAGTASLERDAQKVAFSDLRPSDFFVMSGSPVGHAVLVLDVAKDDRGRLALLLGQSYMPAQSFHVLRASKESAWFVVSPGDTMVETPFWKPFPITALRRLP